MGQSRLVWLDSEGGLYLLKAHYKQHRASAAVQTWEALRDGSRPEPLMDMRGC